MSESAHRDTAALPTADAAGNGIGGFARAALFHYGRLLGNGWHVLEAVAAALQARPDERVLDIGCGTGAFCRAVPGEYVGIDRDPDYIAFARWRWGAPQRSFRTIELAAFGPDSVFDRAIMVNCVHHMSDDAAATLFGQLVRLVRRRFVLADADPEAANSLQAFLLAHDRGRFIRPRAAQRALLEHDFHVVEEGQFRNTPRTAVQTLFVCEPR
jgi:SAM-dependent methyltransferase